MLYAIKAKPNISLQVGSCSVKKNQPETPSRITPINKKKIWALKNRALKEVWRAVLLDAVETKCALFFFSHCRCAQMRVGYSEHKVDTAVHRLVKMPEEAVEAL